MSAEKESPSPAYKPLLAKAEQFLRSAQILSKEGDYDSAASRLYYTMLFIAQALLEAKGLSFSSHRATISAFGQHFAKTNALDPAFHQSLLNAFSQRQLDDYAIHSGIEKEDIDALLLQARAFFMSAEAWLERNQADTSSRISLWGRQKKDFRPQRDYRYRAIRDYLGGSDTKPIFLALWKGNVTRSQVTPCWR